LFSLRDPHTPRGERAERQSLKQTDPGSKFHVALTPNDFSSLTEVETRLLHFQDYYESIAIPFEWKFTRADLAELLKKLDAGPTSLRPAA
jgi:hypothetical protein